MKSRRFQQALFRVAGEIDLVRCRVQGLVGAPFYVAARGLRKLSTRLWMAEVRRRERDGAQ